MRPSNNLAWKLSIVKSKRWVSDTVEISIRYKVPYFIYLKRIFRVTTQSEETRSYSNVIHQYDRNCIQTLMCENGLWLHLFPSFLHFSVLHQIKCAQILCMYGSGFPLCSCCLGKLWDHSLFVHHQKNISRAYIDAYAVEYFNFRSLAMFLRLKTECTPSCFSLHSVWVFMFVSFFCFSFRKRVSLCSPGQTGSHFVAQTSLEFMAILLP